MEQSAGRGEAEHIQKIHRPKSRQAFKLTAPMLEVRRATWGIGYSPTRAPIRKWNNRQVVGRPNTLRKSTVQRADKLSSSLHQCQRLEGQLGGLDAHQRWYKETEPFSLSLRDLAVWREAGDVERRGQKIVSFKYNFNSFNPFAGQFLAREIAYHCQSVRC
jgi:hypothetical protein